MLNKTILSFVLAVGLCAAPVMAQAVELTAWVQRDQPYPDNSGMQSFLKEVAVRSNGKFKPRLLNRDELPAQKEAMERMKNGSLDVAVVTTQSLYTMMPKMEVLALPFLFSSAPRAMNVLDGDVGQEFARGVLAKGYVVLAWYDGGERSFYTRKPVQFVDDFAKLKLRVNNTKIMTQMMEALGAVPVKLDYDETGAALASGKIDGAESDIIAYEKDGHFKRAPYFFFSNHSIQFEALLVPVAFWKTLSEADQKMFKEAAQNSAKLVDKQWVVQRDGARSRLEKQGVVFKDNRTFGGFFGRMSPIYKRVASSQDANDVFLRAMTGTGLNRSTSTAK